MNAVAQMAIYLLETIFVVGIAGSAIVVLLTFVEDMEVWFNREPRDSAGDEPSAVHAHLSHTTH